MTLSSYRRAWLALGAFLLISTPALAYDYNNGTLVEQTQDTVPYVTGGIGDNELAELEAAKAEYSLHITNTGKTGAYVSDAAVVIYDRRKAEVLNTNAGPLLYANLPAGRYTVTTEFQGVVQTKKVTIARNKASEIHFLWNVSE